jgi:hypothetical protein
MLGSLPWSARAATAAALGHEPKSRVEQRTLAVFDRAIGGHIVRRFASPVLCPLDIPPHVLGPYRPLFAARFEPALSPAFHRSPPKQ